MAIRHLTPRMVQAHRDTVKNKEIALQGLHRNSPALTVARIAGRLEQRSGVCRPHGRRVKREAGEDLRVSPALPPQR
jgi:hypothetical protein